MKPSVGRIVHYRTRGTIYAALITEVATEKFVNVLVFHPSGRTIAHHNIAFSELPATDERAENTVAWPERA